jgi:hypothetical protein
MKIMKTILQFSFLILCSALISPIQAQSVASEAPDGTLDFAHIKRDLAVFQGVLDTTLKQSLPGPFQILGSSKGTYLPDYGVVFSLEANVYQIRRLSPFDMRPHTQKELSDAHDLMMTRSELVKELIIGHRGARGTLRQLTRGKSHGDHAPLRALQWGGDPKRNYIALVFSVKESVINEYRETKINLDEFAKSVKLLQF